ncbi:hypothetical protein BN136_47 [Cronobacter universalis NCTC 9529]|nr:hypothetical protein BN136_47 [Cronobacter universalis NCTC 9529]
MSRCKDFWIKKMCVLLANLPDFFILPFRLFGMLPLLL